MLTPHLKAWIEQQAQEDRKWPLLHRIAAGLIDAGVGPNDLAGQFPLLNAPFVCNLGNAMRDIQHMPRHHRPPKRLVIRVPVPSQAKEGSVPKGHP